jgi:fructuronate reductase
VVFAEDKGMSKLPRLSRLLLGLPAAAPVRLVHLGLGNFHRAHQAWYTANASDASEWGIAAFTGRRPDAAQALAPQDGLYTLITRSAEGDSFDVIGAISAVHPASDHQAYLDYLRRPELAAMTITVSEAGYIRGPDGHLDPSREVIAADIAGLQGNIEAPVSSLPGRLVAGLLARRAADAGPISILSCDNLPENGEVTRTVVTDLAGVVDDSLLAWMEKNVDFPTSMVDRITPATIAEDRTVVGQARGYEDASPVPTEPFAEWVISGRFPSGRPAWEDAGARLVEDITPYEQRKLWLLNASHSLLAYAASIRGPATIDEPIADPQCRSWVETLWDEACRHLTLPADTIAEYRVALLRRFENPRVRDQLSRIAADGSIKLPVRIVPPLVAERAEGRMPAGGATAIAAWILHLRGHGAPVKDPGADRARLAAGGADDEPTAVSGVLETLRSGLGDDSALVRVIIEQMEAITGQR